MKATFQAPGRVNLIGEHTDYNDGYVLPAAIDFFTEVDVEPATSFTFQTNSAAADGWQIYVHGVLAQLRVLGIDPPPVSMAFRSAVPIGAGLSSSAALEVSSALALLWAADVELPGIEIAKICQRAEVEDVGLRCGIMDQFISLHGQADHAVLLDCRSLAHQPVAIPDGLTLVIANTMVSHALASSEYNIRRQECEAASAALGVTSLRDATTWGNHKRARHIITENTRVLAFVNALEHSDFPALGTLMAASHASLRDDYEVSCLELDTMVALAQSCPGLIGARMTGGGFGGSTINLVETSQAHAFAEKLAAAYSRATGIEPTILLTRAAAGARRQLPSG